MRKFKGLMFATLMVVLVAGVAQAAPINSGTSLWSDLLEEGITLNADSPQIADPAYWTVSFVGSSPLFILASETIYGFGIFDRADHNNMLNLFDNSSVKGSFVDFAFGGEGYGPNHVEASNGNTADFSSQVFGFYLRTESAIFYSDDDPERVVAFAADETTALFAWDTAAFSPNDPYSTYGDFNDFVVSAGSITNVPRGVPEVPEPSTLVLLGGGLLGLGIAGYRRMQKK